DEHGRWVLSRHVQQGQLRVEIARELDGVLDREIGQLGTVGCCKQVSIHGQLLCLGPGEGSDRSREGGRSPTPASAGDVPPHRQPRRMPARDARPCYAEAAMLWSFRRFAWESLLDSPSGFPRSISPT